MLLLFSLSGFLNAVVYTILALLVFFNNPKRKLNKIYALFSLPIIVWAVSYGIWLLSKSYDAALFWARMLSVGAIFIPVSYCHWIFTLLGIEKEKRNKIILFFSYLLTLFFLSLSFTPYYIKDVKPESFFPYWPKPGIVYHFYLILFYGGLVSYSLFQVFKYFKISTGYKKNQLKYIIWGTILGFGGGATNYPLWYGIQIDPWGNFFVCSWGFLCAYSILRYRFMDIRWILGKGTSYVLSFITVGIIAIILMFLTEKIVPLMKFWMEFWLIIIWGILLTLIFFQFLKFYEKLAAKYFYHTFYNTQLVLKALAKKLTKTLDLDNLFSLILNTLLNTFKLERIGIISKRSGEQNFSVIKTINFNEKELLALIKEEFFINYLKESKKLLVTEEIIKIIETTQKEEERKKFKKLQEDLVKNKINICLPLIFEKEIIGMVILGDKISGEAFSSQDIEVLTILSHSASIALKNASLYNEIKNRKTELEKFYKLTVGRELKMVELKNKIRELEKKLKKEEA